MIIAAHAIIRSRKPETASSATINAPPPTHDAEGRAVRWEGRPPAAASKGMIPSEPLHGTPAPAR